MSVQMNYGYATPRGVPGGLYDQSPYVIDTRLNEAENSKMMLGMGVVQGSIPGSNISLPATGAVAAKFEGITVNGFTQQHDLEGEVSLRNSQSVGVLRHGRIYARLADGVEPAYGDDVYLLISAEGAGLFTNLHAEGTTMKINAKFIGSKGSGDVAAVEIYAGA